jgi:uncharacterized damage-inducible protein DinB
MRLPYEEWQDHSRTIFLLIKDRRGRDMVACLFSLIREILVSVLDFCLLFVRMPFFSGIIFEPVGKNFMDNKELAKLYAEELKAEYTATRKCLERVPESLYKYKPHASSMEMGYLALLVAEIPWWVVHIVKEGVIDFVTYKQFQMSTADALVQHFEDGHRQAIEVLQNAAEDELDGVFTLQNNGQKMWTPSKKEAIGSSINHWVHHRGQLTVYLRMNDIPVPSIYGPSADERRF